MDAREFVKSQARKWRRFKCPHCGYRLGYKGMHVVTGRTECRKCGKLININEPKRMRSKSKDESHMHGNPQLDEKNITRVRPKDQHPPHARNGDPRKGARHDKVSSRAPASDEAMPWIPPLELPPLELKL